MQHVSIHTTHGIVQVFPHWQGVREYRREDGSKVTHVNIIIIDPAFRYRGKASYAPRMAYAKFRVSPDFARLADKRTMKIRKEPPHLYWDSMLLIETVEAVCDFVRENWCTFPKPIVLYSKEYEKLDPIG